MEGKIELSNEYYSMQNVTKKILMCLCLDTSYSMIVNDKIDLLNKAVKKIIRTAKEDNVHSDVLDLCIISYGGEKPECICDFTSVRNVEYKEINPNGGTPMGAAIKEGIERIFEEKEKYINVGVFVEQYLVILGDGEADDDIEEEVKKLNNLQSQGKLEIKCFGVGEEDTFESLERFAHKGKVVKCNEHAIEEFFDYLKIEFSQTSLESIGGEI